MRQTLGLISTLTMIVGLVSLWFDDPTRLATALGFIMAGVASYERLSSTDRADDDYRRCVLGERASSRRAAACTGNRWVIHALAARLSVSQQIAAAAAARSAWV
jgi:hypothetical protein